MGSESMRVEEGLKEILETWSRVRPGIRLVATDKDGNFLVVPVSSPTTVLGSFEEESEAEAFAKAHDQVEKLLQLVRKLKKERDDALEAISEIANVVDPANDAYEEHKPVDIAGVLSTAHHWCHFVLAKCRHARVDQ
jgi:hypothetical protein